MHSRRRSLLSLLLVGPALAAAVQAQGGQPSISWTGAFSSSWHSPLNWSPAVVPTAGDNVAIFQGINQPDTFLTDAACRDLVVHAGASLTLDSGYDLEVHGGFVYIDGALTAAAGSEVALQAFDTHVAGVGSATFADLVIHGSAVLDLGATVTDKLELESGASLTTPFSQDVQGDVVLGSQASWDLSYANHTVGGNWTSSGGLATGLSGWIELAGSGSVIDTGAGGISNAFVTGSVQLLDAVFPNNLLVFGQAIVPFGGHTEVLGALNVQGGGELVVSPAAELVLPDQTATIHDTGQLSVTGLAGLPALVRAGGSAGFDLRVEGTLLAFDFEFEGPGPGGVVIPAQANVIDLSNGVFSSPSPVPGSALLDIQRSVPSSFPSLAFQDVLGLGTYGVRTLGGSSITFPGSTGALAGKDKADNPFSLLEFGLSYTITNGIVELTVREDPKFGLVHESVRNLTLTPPAPAPDVPDGVVLFPTDSWKVTLRDKLFGGPAAPYSCGPTSDGLVHVRPSSVPSADCIVACDGGPAADALSATWALDLAELHASDALVDPDLGAFPTAGTLHITVTYECRDDNDFVSGNLAVRVDAPGAELSVYRVELLTGIEIGDAPDAQVLAAPWYFGAALRDPLSSEIVALSDCSADARLSDPELGKSVATHPGVMAMQFLAYYESDDPGADMFYWATHDTGNHLKPFFLYSLSYDDAPGLGFGTQYYPEDNLVVTGMEAAEGITLPFDVTLTATQGDWFDAAQRYRAWVEAAGLLPPKPGDPASLFSEAVRTAPALGVVTLSRCDLVDGGPALAPNENQDVPKHYPSFADWQPEWDGLKAYFGVDSIVSRVFFWDHNSFDASFLDWFPIRAEFLDGQLASDPWAPYFHPLIVDENSASYASSYIPELFGGSLAPFTIKDEFGADHANVLPAMGKLNPACGVYPKTDWQQQVLCPAALLDPMNPASPSIVYLYAQAVLDRMDAPAYAGAGPMGYHGLYLDEYHHLERICYDPGHGHPVGNGADLVDYKQIFAWLIKNRLRLKDPEAFLWIESASEKYLRYVEVCNTRYSTVYGSESPYDQVPMFQAVYNEYQRFAKNFPVNRAWTEDPPKSEMLDARNAFARHAHESGEVPLGTELPQKLLVQNMADKPHFAQTVEMIRRFVQVLKTTEAGDLLRFGRRFRDPKAELTPVPLPTLGPSGWEGVPAGSLPIDFRGGPILEPPGDANGALGPAVYVSASGEPGARIGLLFVNWTAYGDDAAAPEKAVDDPGTYNVRLTIDPEEYGFTSADHGDLVLTNVATGTSTSLPWFGGEASFEQEVPAVNAVMLVLERD
ncbi:MAG: DUF6259 domain-containing protein [Planctomycetota bacterium]